MGLTAREFPETCTARHPDSGVRCVVEGEHGPRHQGWSHYPGQLVTWPTEKRDKRGRRIGYNWWREYNCNLLAEAEAAWQAKRESGEPIHSGLVPGASYDTAYYQLSEREYRMIHPRPTLKDFLVANAGMGVSHDVEAA